MFSRLYNLQATKKVFLAVTWNPFFVSDWFYPPWSDVWISGLGLSAKNPNSGLLNCFSSGISKYSHSVLFWFRRGSRILVSWGPARPQGGVWAQNLLKKGGFPLKLRENCMIWKNLGGTGGRAPRPPWKRSCDSPGDAGEQFQQRAFRSSGIPPDYQPSCQIQ